MKTFIITNYDDKHLYSEKGEQLCHYDGWAYEIIDHMREGETNFCIRLATPEELSLIQERGRKEYILDTIGSEMREALKQYMYTPATSRVTAEAQSIVGQILMKHYRNGNYVFDPLVEYASVYFEGQIMRVSFPEKVIKFYYGD